MTFIELTYLIKRNILLIVLIVLFCLTAGYFAGISLSRFRYENSVFLSIGIKDSFKKADPFENLQAADQITESIQGWLRDPSFEKDVQQTTGQNYSIKAKKQEKNNLIISFNSADSSNSGLFKNVLLDSLFKKIDSYNNSSDLQIIPASYTFSTTENRYLNYLIYFVALFFGLCFGILFSYFFEKFTGKFVYTSELTGLLAEKRPYIFHNPKQLTVSSSFFLKYLQQTFAGSNSIQILYTVHNTPQIKEILIKEGTFKTVHEFSITKDLEQVNPELPSLLICQSGKTPKIILDNLSQLKFKHLELLIFLS